MLAPPLTSKAGITSKSSTYGQDPIQEYLGVDYLDRAMPTFNKSWILPPTKLSPMTNW